VVEMVRDNEGNIAKEIRMKEGEHSVQSGTLDALILTLFDDQNKGLSISLKIVWELLKNEHVALFAPTKPIDVTFVDTFLLASRMYIPSNVLLQQIGTLFESGAIKKSSAVRIVGVVKKWIQRYWLVDFQVDKLQGRLDEFWLKIGPHVISSGQENLSLVARMTTTQVGQKQEERVSDLR